MIVSLFDHKHALYLCNKINLTDEDRRYLHRYIEHLLVLNGNQINQLKSLTESVVVLKDRLEFYRSVTIKNIQ